MCPYWAGLQAVCWLYPPVLPLPRAAIAPKLNDFPLSMQLFQPLSETVGLCRLLSAPLHCGRQMPLGRRAADRRCFRQPRVGFLVSNASRRRCVAFGPSSAAAAIFGHRRACSPPLVSGHTEGLHGANVEVTQCRYFPSPHIRQRRREVASSWSACSVRPMNW